MLDRFKDLQMQTVLHLLVRQMIMKTHSTEETMVLIYVLEQKLFRYSPGSGGASCEIELAFLRNVIGEPTSRRHGRTEHGELELPGILMNMSKTEVIGAKAPTVWILVSLNSTSHNAKTPNRNRGWIVDT